MGLYNHYHWFKTSLKILIESWSSAHNKINQNIYKYNNKNQIGLGMDYNQNPTQI